METYTIDLNMFNNELKCLAIDILTSKPGFVRFENEIFTFGNEFDRDSALNEMKKYIFNRNILKMLIAD